MTEENKKTGEQQQETVTFNLADRVTYGALNYDGNELMAVISGYDIDISFNMRLINSLADAESCADALADVFYQILMEQLIALKPEIPKPDNPQPPIL